jgi:hypothetical protein
MISINAAIKAYETQLGKVETFNPLKVNNLNIVKNARKGTAPAVEVTISEAARELYFKMKVQEKP